MIDYIFPRVFSDGVAIGDIVTALINNPKAEAEILRAHDAAWVAHQGSVSDKATEAAIAAADVRVQQIRQQMDAVIAENAELKRRLVPDLRPIVEALRGVGLYQWMADAASKDPNLLDEVAAMNAAAIAGDVPNLVANYAAIVAVSPPGEEMLRSWQAVLDAAGVPPQILAFIQ